MNSRKSFGHRRLRICQWLVASWFPLMLWANFPGPLPGAKVAAGLQLLALLAFVVVHASLVVGWRGGLAFLFVAYATGFVLEATSINTGIPFGWFRHLAPGPKPLGVPLYVPLGYAFLGWPAWCLACLLGRQSPALPSESTRWFVPMLGALILTGYDLAFDPIGSAIQKMWAYRYPGGVFGVPLSNFLGWIVTGWAMLTLFSFIEQRLLAHRSPAVEQRGYWLLPVLIWGGMVLQYPLLQFGAPSGEVLVGARRFVIDDIYACATITSILAMLPPALAAMCRVLLIQPEPTESASPIN